MANGPAAFGRNGLTRSSGTVLALSVALFLLAIAIQRALPQVEENTNSFAPSFKVTGRLDERLALRVGTIELTELRVAESLVDGERTFDTSGIWVLVDYHFVGSTQATTLWPTLVTRGGVEYSGSARLPSQRPGQLIEGNPELSADGTLTFEVPASEFAGSAVSLGVDADKGRFIGHGVWDTEAVVGLGVDGARAAELVRTAPAELTVEGG